jgi:hypothetical protein
MKQGKAPQLFHIELSLLFVSFVPFSTPSHDPKEIYLSSSRVQENGLKPVPYILSSMQKEIGFYL